MTDIQIITPPGMFGASPTGDPIDLALRVIGVGFGEDGDWCAKYGADFENDVFLMKRFCWCERGDGSCPWCVHGDHSDFDKILRNRFGTVDYRAHADRHYYDPPNFWFKPSDFRLTWYKYIGRDMASNKDELPGDFMRQIFATHPNGMTLEQAIDETQRQMQATAESFAKIFSDLGVNTSST